ncbi:hypothetical protein BGM19_18780 [Streptomyces agglomeratus]|uniref:Uncharacterized protein n=1 Tax=Streptomyces agglomeratus TaxID=285458 RepID=A0A1E5P9J1_9ACTN|nr:hypothetical protein [Streptomyces agglomeratus]OEJ26155.1 hypothetical protein AS594_18265 [Streptomyces agglomeratus]OEJ52352.1 hypothetical protein BGK72_17840 [Streptomyces agglomeratus]OEJ59726.1 hypothetical protein BGM19_18780 [Streptomyces agglomeratus]
MTGNQFRTQTRTLTARAALAAALGLGALLTVGAPAASAADAQPVERPQITTAAESSTAGGAGSGSVTADEAGSTAGEAAQDRCILYIGGTCKVRATGPGAGIFKPGGHVVIKPGTGFPGGLNTFDWA